MVNSILKVWGTKAHFVVERSTCCNLVSIGGAWLVGELRYLDATHQRSSEILEHNLATPRGSAYQGDPGLQRGENTWRSRSQQEPS